VQKYLLFVNTPCNTTSNVFVSALIAAYRKRRISADKSKESRTVLIRRLNAYEVAVMLATSLSASWPTCYLAALRICGLLE